LQIVGYEFEEPFVLRTTTFNKIPAVYVIYTVVDGKTIWLDVGEADDLEIEISGHRNKDCWIKNAQGNELYIGVKRIEDEFIRINTESSLRNLLIPACSIK
jgi:hypothetical protein